MDSSGFWYQEPLRIIQTVLRQIDAIDYDPQTVVGHVKENNANVLVVNAGGSPVQTGHTSLPLCAPCYNSYYRNEHAEEFIRYVLQTYGVDGIWRNAVLIQHTCHCERCRASYWEYAGTDIPVRTGLDLYDAADVFDFLLSVAFLTENAVNLTYDNLMYPSILTRFLRSLAPVRDGPARRAGGR